MVLDFNLQRAARHMLQNLDDADALRRNWLAARFFDPPSKLGHELILADRKGLARARAAIIEAVDGLGGSHGKVECARHREIAVRCDLGGEAHKRVAADLGISIRQFYRELRQSRIAIARSVAEFPLGPIVEAVPRPTDVDVNMDFVEALVDIGRFEEAMSRLRSLAKDVSSAKDRVRIWCTLVQTACDAGKVKDAREALAAAHQTRLLFVDSEGDKAEIDAAIELAIGVVALQTGDRVSAMRTNERVAALLRSSRTLTAREAFLLALALIRAGCQYSMCGLADNALAVLQQARELLGTGIVSRSGLYVNYYNTLGAVHAIMPGGIGTAVELFRKAYAMGRDTGALRGAAEAAGSLCGVYLWRGEIDNALSYGKVGLTLANSVCGEDEIGLMAGNVSHVYAEANRGDDALALAAVAQAHATPGSVESALGLVAEAKALVSARGYRAAVRVADKAVAATEHLGVQRFVGAALCIKSEAQNGNHQRSEAIESIRSSIEILEKHGHPFSLAGAYRYSARVTGNRRHAAQAQDLSGSLQR